MLTGKTTSRRRILLVDDNTKLLGKLAKLVEGMGHDVATANSGLEAIRLARREKFDAAVVDVYMPGLDGITVRSELIKLGIKVLLISGISEAPQIVGDAYFLMKPFTMNTLDAALVNLWSNGH